MKTSLADIPGSGSSLRRFGKPGAAILSLALVAIAFLAWRNGEFGDKARQSEENGLGQDGIHGSEGPAGSLKAEETGKPKRRLKVPERYMKELSPAEVDVLGVAMAEVWFARLVLSGPRGMAWRGGGMLRVKRKNGKREVAVGISNYQHRGIR